MYINKQPHEDLNRSWTPTSERFMKAGDGAFAYDRIYKIEFKMFGERVNRMLTEVGFDSDKVEAAIALNHSITA